LEYFTKEEKIDDNTVKVKIWDTAGQEQYKSLTRNFYRNSDGVVIMFDVTDKTSFEKVQEWIKSVEDNSDRDISMILVGNKIDLPKEVTFDLGKELADFYKLKYFEISVKDGVGVTESMLYIIKEIYYKSIKSKKDNNAVSLKKQSSNDWKCSQC